MGYFSWLTADTQKSIANVDTGRCRTVYMLQPDGKPSLCEKAYDGYGVFDGVDAHRWLAEMNAPHPENYSPEELRHLGVSLELGEVLEDPESGTLWCIHDKPLAELIGGENFPGRWDEVMPAFGKTPNELTREGRLVRKPVPEVFHVRYPLKFSFNPHARYEDMSASQQCPDQGFFYDDDE